MPTSTTHKSTDTFITPEERREREAHALSEAILDAAMDIYATKGMEGLTMRAIAGRIGYSPGAIYRYFSGKEAILGALCNRGADLFEQRMASCETSDITPLELLRCRGKAYIDFAREEPAYHELMFMVDNESKEVNEAEVQERSRRKFADFVSLVQRCQQQGTMQGEEPHVVAVFLWSLVQGLSTLLASGQFDQLPVDDTEGLVDRILDFSVR